MTIKKQWMRFGLFISLSVVLMNSVFIGFFIQRNFNTYLSEENSQVVAQLEDFSLRAIENQFPSRFIEQEFQNRIQDPVVEVRLYDASGRLIAYAKERKNGKDHGNDSTELTIPLTSNDQDVGILIVSVVKDVGGYEAAQTFIKQLIVITGISFIVVGAIGIVLANRFSKKTVKELEQIAQLANDLQVGVHPMQSVSKIKEIQTIQHALLDFNTKLKLKQKARKELVDELVHQTRTPLTILQTHMEAIQDGVIACNEEEITMYLTQIHQIELIISNITNMIETQNDQLVIEKSTFQLDELIHQICNGLKLSYQNKQVHLQVDVEPMEVFSDPYLITQAIYNLLTNALKFSQTNGTVSISLHRVNERACIEIKDEGIGMSEQTMAMIFEPYYQYDGKQYGGSGIGLYVAKENIESLGGQIFVQSKLQEQTIFTILL